MLHRISKGVLLATAITVGMAGVAASAEDDEDEAGWWPRWGMGQMMGGGPAMGWWSDGMIDRVDGRLAFLKAELKITDAQTPAWDEFTAAIRKTAETRNAMMQTMMKDMQDGSYAKKTLPDRLAEHQTHMEARLEEVKALRASVDKLYAALDETQKKAAEEIALPMMGMGMGMMGPGMGGRMMMR